jgi:tetratricopeptide (TPR) repeat protein
MKTRITTLLTFLSLVICPLLHAQDVPEKYEEIWDAVNGDSDPNAVKKQLEILRIQNPTDPWIFWISGIACNPVVEVEQACTYYRGAIAADSTFPHAYYNLAHSLPDSTSDQQLELIRLFSKAVQYSPDLGFAFLGRGDVYFEMGNYDLALKDAESALKIKDFDKIQGERLKLEVLWKLGKKQEAFNLVRKNDFNVDMWGIEFELVLAPIFEEMGDQKQACDCYFRVSSMYELFDQVLPLEIEQGVKKCR